MPDNFVETHIRRLPLFANLPPEQTALIASVVEVRRYNPAEWVFVQGQPTQGLWMLVSGLGGLTQIGTDGVQRQVATVSPNQFVGQEFLMRDGVESFSFHVAQQATILVLTRARLMALFSQYPALAASFGIKPQQAAIASDAQFKGQRASEEILILTRRHRWAFVRMLWMPFGLLVLLGGLGLLITVDLLTLAFIGLGLVLSGVLTVYLYLEWRNDAIVVTDERVVRIKRTILTFSENITEVPIASIHEVNLDIPSTDPFALLFGYGHIELKSAGKAGNLMLDMVPNPRQFQQIILDDKKQYQAREAEKARSTMRADMDKWLGGQIVDTPQAQKPKATSSAAQGFSLLSTRKVMPNGDILYRKHPYIWLKGVFLPGMVMLLALVIGFLTLFVPFLQSLGLIAWAGAGLMFIVGALWFYFADWDWRNDTYLVSDSTITLVHQRPLWMQNESDKILLSQVDSVMAETSGFWAQIFQYGDVRISLVGADVYKVFETVPNPTEIQAEISRRQARLKEHRAEETAKQQRQLIGEYISIYDQLRNPNVGPTPMQPTIPDAQAVPMPTAGITPNLARRPTGPLPTMPSRDNAPPPAQPIPDRNRPPNVPQQKLPYMSPGKPYSPPSSPAQDASRPPNIPRVRPRNNNQG